MKWKIEKWQFLLKYGRAEIFQEYMKSLFHFMLKEIFAEGKEQTYPVQIVFGMKHSWEITLEICLRNS